MLARVCAWLLGAQTWGIAMRGVDMRISRALELFTGSPRLCRFAQRGDILSMPRPFCNRTTTVDPNSYVRFLKVLYARTTDEVGDGSEWRPLNNVNFVEDADIMPRASENAEGRLSRASNASEVDVDQATAVAAQLSPSVSPSLTPSQSPARTPSPATLAREPSSLFSAQPRLRGRLSRGSFGSPEPSRSPGPDPVPEELDERGDNGAEKQDTWEALDQDKNELLNEFEQFLTKELAVGIDPTAPSSARVKLEVPKGPKAEGESENQTGSPRSADEADEPWLGNTQAPAAGTISLLSAASLAPLPGESDNEQLRRIGELSVLSMSALPEQEGEGLLDSNLGVNWSGVVCVNVEMHDRKSQPDMQMSVAGLLLLVKRGYNVEMSKLAAILVRAPSHGSPLMPLLCVFLWSMLA